MTFRCQGHKRDAIISAVTKKTLSKIDYLAIFDKENCLSPVTLSDRQVITEKKHDPHLPVALPRQEAHALKGCLRDC